MKPLYLIITDFNGYAQTRSCLLALRASKFRDFTVLLVDHGTTDETFNGLREEFPEVLRIAGSSDLWWTGATNLGIRSAIGLGADRIMLLNNDCYVTPSTIGTLVEQSFAYPEAIISSVQRAFCSSRTTFISPRSCFLLGFPTILGPKQLTAELINRELLPVALIIGGRGVIIPVQVLRKLGLFDEEHLPHYGADHDFYLRARLQKIPLYVATRAYVDIDHTHTTLADNPGSLSFSMFLHTLRSIRSHRNIHDVTMLFRKWYPIPGFYVLGVVLCIGRYVMIYAIRRVLFLLKKGQ
jgi:GT2 family glycosyltransferase